MRYLQIILILTFFCSCSKKATLSIDRKNDTINTQNTKAHYKLDSIVFDRTGWRQRKTEIKYDLNGHIDTLTTIKVIDGNKEFLLSEKRRHIIKGDTFIILYYGHNTINWENKKINTPDTLTELMSKIANFHQLKWSPLHSRIELEFSSNSKTVKEEFNFSLSNKTWRISERISTTRKKNWSSEEHITFSQTSKKYKVKREYENGKIKSKTIYLKDENEPSGWLHRKKEEFIYNSNDNEIECIQSSWKIHSREWHLSSIHTKFYENDKLILKTKERYIDDTLRLTQRTDYAYQNDILVLEVFKARKDGKNDFVTSSETKYILNGNDQILSKSKAYTKNGKKKTDFLNCIYDKNGRIVSEVKYSKNEQNTQKDLFQKKYEYEDNNSQISKEIAAKFKENGNEETDQKLNKNSNCKTIVLRKNNIEKVSNFTYNHDIRMNELLAPKFYTEDVIESTSGIYPINALNELKDVSISEDESVIETSIKYYYSEIN